jgi:hypothetical protein
VQHSRLLGTSIAVAALLAAADAAADLDKPNGSQPVAYVERPLTMPSLSLAPTAQVIVDKLSQQTLMTLAGLDIKDAKDLHLTLNVGFRFGIVESIEIGGIVAPVELLPKAAYGNPSLWGKFRFVKGVFELAANFGTTFITHDAKNPQLALPVVGSNAGILLEPGLLSRIHLGSKAKLDIGALVPIELGAGGQDLGLKAPVQIAVNIIESVYVGADSGFGITSITKAPALSSYVPLGLIAGYTLEGAKGPTLDVGALFLWPKFANPGAPDKMQKTMGVVTPVGKVDVADWQAGVSVAAYLYFL